MLPILVILFVLNMLDAFRNMNILPAADVFCGEHLLCARLRSADRGAAHGVVAELQRIVTRLREAWPQVRNGSGRQRILQRRVDGLVREGRR